MMRMLRRNPAAAARANAAAVTIAQFAPETAVRWLRELAFMASSSVAPTALVSPIASPGTSAPPSPPSDPAASPKPVRRSPLHASQNGGAAAWMSPATRNRKAEASAAGNRVAFASNVSVVPSCSCSGGRSTVTVTGTAATRMPSTASTRPSTRCGSPDAAASSPPSNHGADIARGAPLSSTTTLTVDPLDAASTRGERSRASRALPADVATSPVAASATSSAAHRRTAACDTGW